MSRWRLRLLLFGALLMTGCRIVDQLTWRPARDTKAEALNTWIGQDVRTLISQYGPPTQVYPNGDRTLYSWDTNVHAVANYNQYGGVAYRSACVTWFEAGADGVVLNWRYKGRC